MGKMNIISLTIEKMVEYFHGDVKRINHALKVYGFTKTMGELEKLSKEEQEILQLAAILHDIGIQESERKYLSSAGRYQEIEGPPIARGILKEFSLNEDVLDRICFLIGYHHSYHKIDHMDFQILVEADFLVNIFEDEMDRKQIETIKEKYFKTSAGLFFLNSMYLKK